jgi:crooked neck
MPELLWKAYIDFEIEEGERENARESYEHLVKQSGHVKVWISYALFEGEAIPVPRAEREEDEDEEDEEADVKMVAGDPVLARQVFERGYKDLKERGLKSEVCWFIVSLSNFTDNTPSARRFTRNLEILRRNTRYT